MDNNNQKKECDGNQKTGQGDSDHGDTSWEVKPVRPCKQKRLRMSEARELRRGKKAIPQRPELDFTHNPHLSEKFSTRRDGGNQDAWTSEKDQLARLGLPALGGRGTLEGIEFVPKNPLVAQFEYEIPAFPGAPWRFIPEVPTPEELMKDDVEVPTNVIDGCYESVDDYLGTHYELVREDTLAGLRAAVQYVQKNPLSDDTREIAIYDHVEIQGLTFVTNIGICTKVSFWLGRSGKQIRWQQSKRLIPGSLVCLSKDDFKTFRVATVAARPMSGVEKNPPEVDLFIEGDGLEIDAKVPWLMVESRKGYFEASKWVLKAMQRMTEKNMPLKEHIVSLDGNVSAPQYLAENPVYNLTSIFPDAKDLESVERVNILDDWPADIKSSLDRSQTDALKAILTQRVAVVQGPPGTGKTYVSVTALHAMLANMTDSDPPVIVACQTNHALDQLLRHVYKFEQDIIRLGGRTQDRDEIKSRTIFNVRKSSKIKVMGRGMQAILKELDATRQKIIRLLEPLAADLISPDALFEFKLISEAQKKSFFDGASGWVHAAGDDKPTSPIATWLHSSLEALPEAPDVGIVVEDPDLEYEALLDLEAEFVGNNGDDDEVKDELSGYYFLLKRSYEVKIPEGIEPKDFSRALRKQDVWKLPEYMRAAVYRHWEAQAVKLIQTKLQAMSRDYQKLSHELKVSRMERDSFLLSQCKLVGMTTTGLSKYRTLVASCQPKVVMIEEAAECLEAPVVVGCLPSVQHLILVGDHKQLKGKVNEIGLMSDPYNLDTSMFERWVRNEMPYVALQTQRRMRPEIREILEPIYPGQLRDHESVLGRENVQGMGGINLYWHCHNGDEETMSDSPSKCNHFEAESISKFVEYLVLNSVDPNKITILTFYTGQRQLLARTLRRNINFRFTNFKIATVDSYQGEENDIIILSLVRSNPQGNIGFLSNENRVCVALSRAQRGFYIFGNAAMVTRADKLWWDIGSVLNTPPAKIGYTLPLTCQQHNERTLIDGPHSWDDISGGCRRPCATMMACGHVCPLRCHPFTHEQYRCLHQCKRISATCGHQCVKLCYDEECACAPCGVFKGGAHPLEVSLANLQLLAADDEDLPQDSLELYEDQAQDGQESW